MSEAPDRELEDEVRALLRPVREPPAAPAEVKARALRRLALALPIGGGGGGGSGTAPPSPTVSSPATGLRRALVAKVPAWSLLASFVAGAAAMMIARPVPVTMGPQAAPNPGLLRSPSLPAPPSPSAALPSPSVAPSSSAPAAPVIAPIVTAEAPRPSARPAADGLEAERALLDVARTALGRGDGANALRAAEEHGRRFPRGILAEEREAMSIQALRLLHRDDDAQARLARFRGRFPTSLMRPALEVSNDGAASGPKPRPPAEASHDGGTP